METSRLATFADGVFAIAATLLVIDVSVRAEGDRLGHAIVHAWPQYAAYAVSFITIGIMWINHHNCMRQIGKTDQRFMVINLFLLMCIAFVPFPTRLVADHFHDGGLRAAALTYGITMVATAICFNLFWFYPTRNRRLVAEDADVRVIKGISRAFAPGVPIYAAATLLALWSPKGAVIFFGAIAAFYVLESSVFTRSEPQPI